MLRKSVTGDVRFLKQRESGNASAGELVPLGLAHRMQIHLLNQSIEQRPQRIHIG